jgi:branched-chain amino acid transport system ATP-binding protein
LNLLEGTQVTKDFGGLRALNELNFQVNEGEIFGIIGPNGSGKTTLFNIITGAYPPTSGSIAFEGKAITGMKSYAICRRGISRTYQIVRPFLNLTVIENIMAGICFGRGEAMNRRVRDRAMKILGLLDLAEKHNRLAKDLTVAERKRLEIGRALATNPRVILLDEVMAGLNPKEVGEMVNLVERIHDMGKTVCIIEHVMKAVSALCHRILVLNYGKKLFEGTPEEVANSEEVIKAYLGRKRSMETG